MNLKNIFKTRAQKMEAKGELTKKRLRAFLPENPVIVEAGAHVGRDTVEMSHLWPAGTIHAFEPVPELFEKLTAATRDCPNVIRHESALSNKTGTLKLNLSSGKSDASSSLLEPKQHLEQHPDVSFDQQLSVPCVTLEDWAREQQIDHVDFLWLDLQGYELFALQAAGNILSTVRAIYAEVYLKESYEGVPLYADVRAWLEGRGFRVEWEGLPWPDMGNVLFVRQAAGTATRSPESRPDTPRI